VKPAAILSKEAADVVSQSERFDEEVEALGISHVCRISGKRETCIGVNVRVLGE
jgi:hypothetical protein